MHIGKIDLTFASVVPYERMIILTEMRFFTDERSHT